MKEAKVQKFHRALGMIIVWFLAAQALSGLMLAAGGVGLGSLPPALFHPLAFLHFGWTPIGGIYRIILGLATLAQGVSGIVIYLLIRARTRKA